VHAGETLSFSERLRIERAVRNAESSSGLHFSVLLGVSEEDSRRYAERLHSALDDPARSVLVLCDPVFRALEIVTGSEARRNLDDVECGLAAASMESSFAGGDIVGGLVVGIQQLGEASRAPRTLHANN
jgi:uncharacterized membrane protein YgcG